MKKKVISTLMGLVLVLSMTTAAFADDTTVTPDSNGDPSPSTAEMTITYDVEPTYTVTIPATVEIGEEVTISAENVRLPEGTGVGVTLVGTSEADGTFKLRNENGNDPIAYMLVVDDDPIIGWTVNYVSGSDEGDYWLLGVNSAAGSGSFTFMRFELYETATYSGTYSGTLTFGISLIDEDDVFYVKSDGLFWD